MPSFNRGKNNHTNVKIKRALTSVAPLVGHSPVKQKVTSSIPGQGTYLGCRFGSWLGCM